jgi:hypothetical protein
MSGTLFTRDDFANVWGEQQLLITLVSQDNYDETKIYEAIKEIDLKTCGGVALQLSIVGSGNKTYGVVVIDKKEIDILEFFNKNQIIWNSKFGDKLEPNTLTPRRLIRFYRYLIQDYLVKNPTKTTYLYRKYCPEKNDLLRVWIFPGAEHLLEPKHENIDSILRNFIHTYVILDERLGTRILDRIKRILYARGFSPEQIQKIIDQININIQLQ